MYGVDKGFLRSPVFRRRYPAREEPEFRVTEPASSGGRMPHRFTYLVA